MPRAGEYCALPVGHVGQCRSAEGVRAHSAGKQDSRRRRVQERQEAVDQYKVQHGCKVCGWREDPRALDLDHTDPAVKVDDVSSMLWYATWEQILAELGKCQVLCANHHRIKTFREKPEKPSPVDSGEGFSS